MSDNNSQQLEQPSPATASHEELPTVELPDRILNRLKQDSARILSEINHPNRGGSGTKSNDMLGELAVAKFYGEPLDDVLAPTRQLTLDGDRIMVTTVATPHEVPPLIVRRDQINAADLHVLAQYVDPTTLQIVGCVSARQLSQRQVECDQYDDLHLIVPPHELQLPPEQ